MQCCVLEQHSHFAALDKALGSKEIASMRNRSCNDQAT